MQYHFLKYYLLSLLGIFSILTNAQVNLVSNPSFEDIDSCYGDPSNLGFDVFQWSGCTGWRNPTYGSSDLWCNNPVFGSQSPPNISGAGYQFPKTGSKMAGIFVYEAGGYPNYREYIENSLSNALEAGKYYEISFYVNSSDTFNYSSSIGVFISDTIISQMSSWNFLPYPPQIQNLSTNFITDTLGWQKISGIYKAIGGEKYITIGCFNDSSSIILSKTDSTTAGGVYLFVDDFSLEEVSAGLNFPNVFSPNSDGLNDLFTLQIYNVSNWRCSIYNRWGQKIFELNEKVLAWDGTSIADGTYYYIFEGIVEEQHIKEKGFLQLLR